MNYARWSTRPTSRRSRSRAAPPPRPPRTRAARAAQQQRRRASSSARRRSTRGIRCCSRRMRAGASTDSASQDGLAAQRRPVTLRDIIRPQASRLTSRPVGCGRPADRRRRRLRRSADASSRGAGRIDRPRSSLEKRNYHAATLLLQSLGRVQTESKRTRPEPARALFFARSDDTRTMRDRCRGLARSTSTIRAPRQRRATSSRGGSPRHPRRTRSQRGSRAAR